MAYVCVCVCVCVYVCVYMQTANISAFKCAVGVYEHVLSARGEHRPWGAYCI